MVLGIHRFGDTVRLSYTFDWVTYGHMMCKAKFPWNNYVQPFKKPNSMTCFLGCECQQDHTFHELTIKYSFSCMQKKIVLEALSNQGLFNARDLFLKRCHSEKSKLHSVVCFSPAASHRKLSVPAQNFPLFSIVNDIYKPTSCPQHHVPLSLATGHTLLTHITQRFMSHSST